MDDEAVYTTAAEFDLEVDENDDDRSAYSAAEERSLRVFGHDNRIGIALRSPSIVKSSDPGRAAYDIGLMMVVHAHPECRFVWSRLVVDLSRTPGAVVEDMVPSEVEDKAVEVETRMAADLKFATVFKAVNVEIDPSLARKRTVHFPTVTSSGVGFHKAYWDFMAQGTDYLHANRELRLLVSAPAGSPVVAAVTVRARVRMLGLRNLVPLRKLGGLESVISLASPAC